MTVRVFLLLTLTSLAVIAQPQAVLWHEGNERIRGATNRFSYSQAYLEWQSPMGDWYDKNGQYLGDSPFSALTVEARGDNWLSWDLKGLLPHIKQNPKLDLLLRLQPGSSGYALLSSKEQGYRTAPSLVLEFADKQRQRINATMDTYLDNTTFRHLGMRDTLKIARNNPTLLAFDLSKTNIAQLTSVRLELNKLKQSGKPKIGVYLLQQPALVHPQYPAKLAASSFFNESFSQHNWSSRWQHLAPQSNITRVKAPQRGQDSYALKVSFTPRQNGALNVSLFTKPLLGFEPESLFFEYDLYLDANWMRGGGAGKFPGFAGTYGRAGWGGRKADGTNGWSARGQFLSVIDSDDELNGLTPLGSYLYLVHSSQSHGEVHPWRQSVSKLARQRWYKISQQLTLNTPGSEDGELLVWVNEQLVLHRTELNFRTVPDLKIERLWFDFYHGGVDKPKHNMDLYISNIKVALPEKSDER
ncbi:polysaccharide lyase [Alishewanella jeotgali]|uniref:Polysaccharide lyase 14 domain-containing protein n=1 Tax=Alishewanella jeotgali KCTC 22429 TaxID=1129374 RepID=H3ZB84_9ALTE|nr:hypothetical protein [Alishewanella jeotgali]EHR42198.1 hypothetical protein AJE_02946 [Alishewanella jeotgali KCTC 22429]